MGMGYKLVCQTSVVREQEEKLAKYSDTVMGKGIILLQKREVYIKMQLYKNITLFKNICLLWKIISKRSRHVDCHLA